MRLFSPKGSAQSNTGFIQSVWDLAGVPSFQQFWNYGILQWKTIYKGYVPAWHDVNAPTIHNEYGKRKMAFMNVAKMVSSELANLIWAEKCKTTVTEKNTEDAENSVLNAYIQDVFRQNKFNTKIRSTIEECSALGGACIRCYADGEKNEEGSIIGNAKVKLGYFDADKFIPTAWDNKSIKEGVFIDKRNKGGFYYTKLEWHQKDGTEYVIKNELYRSDSPDILGIRSPLSEMYANLSEEVRIRELEGSVFTYFGTCMANNIDDNSPLGISIYANALDTLKALDIAFDSFSREFVLGKKRIIVPASAVRMVRDASGNEHRYFDSNDEVYEAMYTDNAEQLKIMDNTISLRVDEHINAINALLNILAMQIGLSAGSLSFDKIQGLKTATEVISENSKTYRFVKMMQEPLLDSIERLVDAIIDISLLYDIHFQYEGRDYAISQLVSGGYDCSIHFDDSIVQDRNADIQEGLQLLQNNIMSKRSFMLNVLKYTPEQAEQELAMLDEENRRTANMFSIQSPFGAE